MSYFDDASLVMIPSGYKTSKVYSVKPTDGTGDLTFTRSNDTATRVGPDGLIEKVRTNLVLQSNSFDTTWTNSNSTDTGGQADKDGGTTAWKIDKTAASGYIRQAISQSGVQTFSVYAKAGTLNWIRLIADGGTSTPSTWFDLQNGVVGAANFFTIDAKIEAAGNGYYRCSISYEVGTITGVRIYPADANNDVSGTSGNILIQDAMLEVGDVMTDYIATTTAAVSVGPVANVPRLDYLGSSCPRLLLEPQRTNVALYSEQFDNAYWTKTNATITANNAVSPDGYTNADLLTYTTSAGEFVSSVFAGTASTAISVSMFVKAGTSNLFNFGMSDGINEGFYYTFNLATQTATLTAAPSFFASPSFKIENYGNGWYRLVVSAVSTSNGQILLYAPSVAGLTANYSIYGAQIEQAAHTTSYIGPTLGAAVTRGADSASKTSASALIGQTEGTMFAEVDFTDTNADQMYLTLSDGTSNNRIHIGFDNQNWIYCNIRSGGSAQGLIIQSSPSSGIKKIAVGYKLDDYVLYINGVQVGVDTSALVPACSRLDVGGYFSAGFEYPVKQALLFPTRLSNADLAALTA